MENENGLILDGRVKSKGVSRKRDSYIDITKCLGIIMMVYRHAESPFSKFVLSFHMALFFITSGCLYNELRINFTGDYYKYVVRKIKSLWIPYVLFNGCFIALQNLFIRFNVYTNNPEFLIKYPGRYATLTMSLNFVDTIKELVKILLF